MLALHSHYANLCVCVCVRVCMRGKEAMCSSCILTKSSCSSFHPNYGDQIELTFIWHQNIIIAPSVSIQFSQEIAAHFISSYMHTLSLCISPRLLCPEHTYVLLLSLWVFDMGFMFQISSSTLIAIPLYIIYRLQPAISTNPIRMSCPHFAHQFLECDLSRRLHSADIIHQFCFGHSILNCLNWCSFLGYGEIDHGCMAFVKTANFSTVKIF